MKKKLLLILTIAVICTPLLLAGGQSPPPEPPTGGQPAAGLDSIIAEAKKEGQLIVYSSYNVAQGQEIHDAFSKKYPSITVEHVQLAGPEVASRIALEVSAGTTGADIGLTGINFLQALAAEGHLKSVDWATLGFNKDVIENEYLLRIATITFTLMWNTDQVPGGLTAWEDLLNPKWKGNISQWVNGEPFAYLVPAWGEAKVDDFLAKLLGNDPVLVSGMTPAMDMLSAGETAVAIGNGQKLVELIGKGAPVDGIWAEPIPVINYDAAIPANAAHPNAAMLYAAWLVSPEGAAVYEKATGRGNLFVPTTSIGQRLKGKAVSTFTPDRMGEAGDLVKKYKAMLEK